MFKSLFNLNKVDFMIVGAQKSGTTSLHYFLNQVNGIKGSNPKETDFFSYNSYYNRGYKFYHRTFFEGLDKNKLYFDASVEYLYLPYVAERLYKYNPKLKLIVCLRDPIERAKSAYKMYRYINSKDGEQWRLNYLSHLKNHSVEYYKVGKEFYSQDKFPEFKELIDIEMGNISKKFCYRYYEPSLIKRGMYKNQIENLLKYFSIDQLHFINADSFKKDTEIEFHKVLNFIGFKEMKQDIDFSQQLKDNSNIKLNLNETLISDLKNIFKDSYYCLNKYAN